jgi:hypothetical protein
VGESRRKENVTRAIRRKPARGAAEKLPNRNGHPENLSSIAHETGEIAKATTPL